MIGRIGSKAAWRNCPSYHVSVSHHLSDWAFRGFEPLALVGEPGPENCAENCSPNSGCFIACDVTQSRDRSAYGMLQVLQTPCLPNSSRYLICFTLEGGTLSHCDLIVQGQASHLIDCPCHVPSLRFLCYGGYLLDAERL